MFDFFTFYPLLHELLPFAKISFFGRFQSSFKIFTWNVIHEFVLTKYRSILSWSCLTFFQLSYCPLHNFGFPDFSLPSCDLDLKFCIWIYLDIIQIKFEIWRVWPNWTAVIVFSYNLVFDTFICRLLRYWHQILGVWIYTDMLQNQFYFCIFSSTLVGVKPFWKAKYGIKCILSYYVPVQTIVSHYYANCVTPLIYQISLPKAQVSYCHSAPSVVRPSSSVRRP